MPDTVELVEDLYIDAECLKNGDYIYPWDDVINADRNQYYKIIDIRLTDLLVIMRLQYMGESLLTFLYKSKRGTKERMFVLN
jgi:hypothetical protein